ncbi:hypothetical protein ACFE04_005507 [Oxalis oulophora]
MDLPMSSSAFTSAQIKKVTWKHTLLLSFQSLGIVYGRLSTAPLYVFGSIKAHNLKTSDAVYEYFSFILWTLTITTLIKYTIIVLRADDEEEGGVFALYSLLCRHAKVGLLPNDRTANSIVNSDADSSRSNKSESRARKAIEKHKSSHYFMLFIALFGSCMMIGDAVFTPSISVLSASSGLQRSLSRMSKHFSSSPEKQNHISHDLKKCKPQLLSQLFDMKIVLVFLFAVKLLLFLRSHYGTRKIGIVFAPIVIVWIFFISGVGLYNIFNFDPHILCAVSPVYLYRFVKNLNMDSMRSLGNIVLCLAGTEAIFADLGHFSKKSIKYTFFFLIYPALIICYAGQAAFISKNSHLADFNHLSESMPGLAIVCGMLVTTCLMSLVIALCWEKNLSISVWFLTFFGFIETVYLAALLLSFHKGSWSLAVLVFVSLIIMLSWHYGTKKKYEFDIENKLSIEWLTDLSPGLGVSRVPGIGFVHTEIVSGVPAFFSHFITNLPAFHQVVIFVSFKSLPVPSVPSNQRYLIGRVGAKDQKIYRCIVRYGYCDRLKDTYDFEEQIVRSIGDFITLEENDVESSRPPPEGKMIIVGTTSLDQNIFHDDISNINVEEITLANDNESVINPITERRSAPSRRKKVRFSIPENTPKLQSSVREELQELIDARESGAAYFLGQSHLTVREGSNFLKRFLIMTYALLDRNCREPHLALNIPQAAIVEVGMVYTI